MEKFKIDHFERENGVGSFPWFRSLEGCALARLQDKIMTFFLDTFWFSPIESMQKLSSVSKEIYQINAEDPNFSLKEMLYFFKIYPKDTLYINWYKFDRIDEVRVADFCFCFDDVWYLGSDDIEFFDDTLGWMFSISHDGQVSLKY